MPSEPGQNNTGGTGSNTGAGNNTSVGVGGQLAYAVAVGSTAKGTTYALYTLDRRSGASTEVARGVIYAGAVYSAAKPRFVENAAAKRMDENMPSWVWFVDEASQLKVLDISKGTVKTITTSRSLATVCDMDIEDTFALVSFTDDRCRSQWKMDVVDGVPGSVTAYTQDEPVEQLHVWTASRQHVGKITYRESNSKLRYVMDSGAAVEGVLPRFGTFALLAAHDTGGALQFWADTGNGGTDLAFRRYSLDKSTGAVKEVEKVIYNDSTAHAYGPRVVFEHVSTRSVPSTRTLMFDDLSDTFPHISQVAGKSLSLHPATMSGRMPVVVDDKLLVLDLTRPAAGSAPTFASLTEATVDVPGFSFSTLSGRVLHLVRDAGSILTRVDLQTLSSVNLPNTRLLITAGSYYTLEYGNGELAGVGYEEADYFYATNVNVSGFVANGDQGATVAWFNPANNSLVGFDTVKSRLFKQGSGNTTGRVVMERATLRDDDPATRDHGFYWIDADARTWAETRTEGAVSVFAPGKLLEPK